MPRSLPSRRPARTTRRAARLLIPALALAPLLLSGCVRFGAKPPNSLLTVESRSVVPPGASIQPGAGSLVLADFGNPRALSTVRVAVRASDSSYAYVPKGVWVDQPRELFRDVLAETLAARNGTLVLDPGEFSTGDVTRLTGELLAFEIDARSRQAVVTFDATAVRPGNVVQSRRFSATAPVSSIDKDHVAGPLGQAANDVAVQVADWLKSGG